MVAHKEKCNCAIWKSFFLSNSFCKIRKLLLRLERGELHFVRLHNAQTYTDRAISLQRVSPPLILKSGKPLLLWEISIRVLHHEMLISFAQTYPLSDSYVFSTFFAWYLNDYNGSKSAADDFVQISRFFWR